MLVKTIIIFLAVMALIAMLGRFRLPKRRAPFCSACGRPLIGRAPCPCGKA
jgi:hypothetical protein